MPVNKVFSDSESNQLVIYPHPSKEGCMVIRVNIDPYTSQHFEGCEYNNSDFILEVEDIQDFIKEIKRVSKFC